MISTQKITTSEVRKYNKNRIFKLIYNSNSISRQEIADTLGLSLPTINQNIKLLKEDLYHLDKIQTQTATARLFLIAVRIKPDDQLEVHSLIHRIEKLIRMQNISVTRADKEMIKRMLAVYFEQNVTTSQFEDYDGKRWYDGVQ